MRLRSLVRKVDDGERTATGFPQVNGDLLMQGEGAWVATPEQVSVWVGLDVGKESHFADVLDNDGERLFSRGISNDQADIEALLDRAGKHGVPGLVIDQPGSIAQLVLAVAARREVPVAYVPGLVMRRAADLYPGEAKTDRLTELREGLWQVSGQVASRVATVPDHDHGRGRAAGSVAAGGAAARVA
jgi:transposase